MKYKSTATGLISVFIFFPIALFAFDPISDSSVAVREFIIYSQLLSRVTLPVSISAGSKGAFFLCVAGWNLYNSESRSFCRTPLLVGERPGKVSKDTGWYFRYFIERR
jgi:hypothetical protein